MEARSRRSPGYFGINGMALAWAMLCILAFALSAGRAQAAPFAAVVMDARTGEILHAVNHDTRLHPASLTKMMTLYVAFEAIQNGEISLDTMVRISRRAASEPPSRLGLREGQRIALRHLIRAAALRSGNDAATAIAEAVSGSVEAFAERMNRTAAAIGMRNTNFRNAHGLTQTGHLSTARDMTILGRQLYFDYPQYYNIFSRRSEDAGIAHVRNTNSRFLDAYPGADGIKTGFTNAAGYNLTAMAERGGVRIVVTVFGGRSVAHRHEQVVQLMNRGFREAPSRATVRRPSPPNYAVAPLVAAAGDTGRAAARVIRLQTAPERSVFPAPRPLRPGEQPSEALLAALQSEISTVLAEVVAPGADVAGERSPAEPPQALAAADAPDRSPLPPPRPGGDDTPETADMIAARLAGFTVIDQQEYLDLTSEETAEFELEIDPADSISTTMLAAVDGAGNAGFNAIESVPVPEPQLVPEIAVRLPLAETVAEAPLSQPIPPVETLLAAVVIEDGRVVVPGLPPVAIGGAEPVGDLSSDVVVEDGLVIVPGLPPVALDAPAVTEIAALEPAADSRIVLTASDAALPPPANPVEPPMPEIVARVSTSGGRVWSVDLGLYPSRFDAERTLLRVALAENTTLGTGVRRVGQRSGRFVAAIHSLTQDQAELACLRLSTRAQPCEVIHP